MTADAESDPRVLRVRAIAEREPVVPADLVHGASGTDDPPATGAHGTDSAPGATQLRHAAATAADRLRARDTLIEKIIRDAQAAGSFDNLPYQGEALPRHDDAAAGDMASAFRILRNAGAAPEWIETDKEIRRLLGERDVILARASRAGTLSRDRYRTQLRSLVADVNRLVVVLNHEAPTMHQHRRPLDLEREMAELERRWPR